MRIETVYSPDDGGYYCEVVDVYSGRTLHTTAVYRTRALARRMAANWAESQLPTRNA